MLGDGQSVTSSQATHNLADLVRNVREVLSCIDSPLELCLQVETPIYVAEQTVSCCVDGLKRR